MLSIPLTGLQAGAIIFELFLGYLLLTKIYEFYQTIKKLKERKEKN